MNTLVTFRQARKADLFEIVTFPMDRTELFYFFPSATYPLTVKQLEQQLCKRHQSTVMLSNKQLIGFANFYNVLNRNIAFIGNVIIKPEKRGQGLGRKLIQTMITTGFSYFQLKEVHLSCYEKNISALLFYRHLGFKPYASETRYDPDNEPAEMIHLKVNNPDL